MKKQDIKNMIIENKIVAILRGLTNAETIDTVDALVKGGIKMLEFTFDHNDTNFILNTTNKIKLVKEHFGDNVCVGAGTVLTVEEVEEAIKAGAEFIISPNVNIDVIRKTNELGKVSMPGALTPTEAVKAYNYGADYIKLFPAGELGKNYIKALMSPLQHIPFIAVGGINAENISEFLGIGIKGVGVGGQLVNKKLIKEKNYEEVTKIAKKFIKNI